MRSVVVLPQPDGPSKVVKLPRGISSDTSSTAGRGAWREALAQVDEPNVRLQALGSSSSARADR